MTLRPAFSQSRDAGLLTKILKWNAGIIIKYTDNLSQKFLMNDQVISSAVGVSYFL